MKRIPRPALLVLLFLAAVLGPVGCVNPSAGDTSSTTLYAYDDVNKQVLAWNDVNQVYNLAPGSTAAPAPDRTITSTLITSMGPLAWGGMVASPAYNELYLVSETGNVVRIERASSQNGALSAMTDIATFTIGNASVDRLANSLFTQCAIDPGSGTLYAIETGTNGAWRVWVVALPQAIPNTGQSPGADMATLIQSSVLCTDTGAFGIATGGSGTGNVFLFLTGGQTIIGPTGALFTGPRLRLSQGATVSPYSNVLVGNPDFWDQTNTPAFGSLGFDTTSNLLYLARPISNGDAPVLVFTASQFTVGTLDAVPSNKMADTYASLSALRIITHAGSKDWMAGADQPNASTDAGTNIVHLWKAPSQSGASIAFTLPTTGSSPPSVKGLVLTAAQ